MNALVTDDSNVLRAMIALCLKRLGLTVTEAVDGEDAWSKLEAGRFDLVIMDLNMPKLTGLQLVARMRATAKYQRLPVIMVTTETGREAGLAAGVNEYLFKPFNPQQLMVAVKRLLPTLAG